VLLTAQFASTSGDAAASRPSIKRIISKAKVLQPGRYRLGKRRMRCRSAKTVISPRFWDYGGAIPGYIIMNPRKLRRVPAYVRMFIYYHECGHQFYGRNELRSDCYAIRRGREEGWLNARRVRNVCNMLFKHSKGDRYHPPGPLRCRKLNECYKGQLVRQRQPNRNRGSNIVDALENFR